MNQFLQYLRTLLVIPRGKPAKQALPILAADCERAAVFAEFFWIELRKQRSGGASNKINSMFQTRIQIHSGPFDDRLYR